MNFLKRQTIHAQQHTEPSALSRRHFLQAAGLGGGLLIGSGFVAGSAQVFAAEKTPVLASWLNVAPSVRAAAD